eukprot:9484754-Pyramimonas_sp.AAC.1
MNTPHALLHASSALGIRRKELMPLKQGVEHAYRRSMRLPLPAISSYIFSSVTLRGSLSCTQ